MVSLPRDILTESHRRASELYQASELALLLTGPQFWQQIEDNAPSIAAITNVAPQITNDLVSANLMNVVIPQQSQQSEAALQLALFLTKTNNQLAFAQLANILPSTIASAADPYFQIDSTLRDQARQISAAQLTDTAVLIPPGLDRFRELIYTHLQRAMLAELSIAKAVANVATAWSTRNSEVSVAVSLSTTYKK